MSEDKTNAAGEDEMGLEMPLSPVPSGRGGAGSQEGVDHCNCPFKFDLMDPNVDVRRIGDWMHRRAPRECVFKPQDGSVQFVEGELRADLPYYYKTPRYPDIYAAAVMAGATARSCCASFSNEYHLPECDRPYAKIPALKNIRIQDNYFVDSPSPGIVIEPEPTPVVPPLNREEYKADLMRDMDIVAEESDKPLDAAIGVAIGAGSVCWSNGGSGGVFLSDRAVVIIEALSEWIATNVRSGTILGDAQIDAKIPSEGEGTIE